VLQFNQPTFKEEKLMNKSLKTIALAIILAISGILAGCGDPGVSYADAQRLRELAKVEGERTEAAKADAKLNGAHEEMKYLAGINVARGDFTKVDNCRVDVAGLSGSQAAKDFPHNFRGFYQAACEKAVAANVDSHKKADATAVANAKAKERKLAAAKQKREQKLAAAKAKAAEAKRLAAKKAKSGGRVAATR
jgi:hypothetical protein